MKGRHELRCEQRIADRLEEADKLFAHVPGARETFMKLIALDYAHLLDEQIKQQIAPALKPWEASGYDFIKVYIRKIGKTGGKQLVVEYEFDGEDLRLRGIYDGEPEDGLNWLIANRISLDDVQKAVEVALKARGEEAFAADAYQAMRAA